MENVDKEPTVPKWVLINRSKIPQITNATKFFGPICLPKPKSLGISKKRLSLGVRSPWLRQLQSILNKFLPISCFFYYLQKCIFNCLVLKTAHMYFVPQKCSCTYKCTLYLNICITQCITFLTGYQYILQSKIFKSVSIREADKNWQMYKEGYQSYY